MKKTPLYFLLAALLTACGDGNESHYTDIIYPSARNLVVFADQTTDSLVFASTDSWTLTSSDPSWCTFDESYASFSNPYNNTWVEQKVVLNFTPNTTGSVRESVLKIDGGESSNAAYIAQVPFLGIGRPTRYASSDLRTDTIVSLTLSNSACNDSVVFRVYSDWTLVATDGSWYSLSKTSGTAGDVIVYLTATENTNTTERKDTLRLTSNGVEDFIPLLQKAAKLTEE